MEQAVLATQPDLAALDDAALVALALDNDERSVRTLVQRYNQRLFRVARGVVRDEAEAEDIVQETFVRAFTNLQSFRGRAALSTWLTRIALNASFGRLRRQRRFANQAELSATNEGRIHHLALVAKPPTPESETARGEIRKVLEQAVDGLPDPFRLVFVLREVEGLSVEETASLLSIKPATVKTRLHRARRLMRGEVQRRLAGTFDQLFPFGGGRCARVAEFVVQRLSAGR